MPSITTLNGQIYTPGLAIINSPQPYTPLGGENLHIAIDVSGNGRLPLNFADDAPTRFHNISLFLTASETQRNFTISNGTSSDGSRSALIGPVLGLEPGSTVKHVNWIWPDCFADEDENNGSAKGAYNISFHQKFRLDGTEYYTVFDLPIEILNTVERSKERAECAVLENEYNPALVMESNASLSGIPWVRNGEGSDTGTVVIEEESLGVRFTEGEIRALLWFLMGVCWCALAF